MSTQLYEFQVLQNRKKKKKKAVMCFPHQAHGVNHTH